MPSRGAAGQASTVPSVKPWLYGRCAMIKDHETIDVLIGVDVGKSDHHAVALNKAGKKLWDKALPTSWGMPQRKHPIRTPRPTWKPKKISRRARSRKSVEVFLRRHR